LSDGAGLHLLVNPDGSRYWRFRYYWAGRERYLSVGVWPAVGLDEARAAVASMRDLLARGIDPSAQRKADKAERRTAQEAPARPARFLIDHTGVLSVCLPGRVFTLAPAEVRELRAFLAATATVGVADHGE
jgi:hypothetical protein